MNSVEHDNIFDAIASDEQEANALKKLADLMLSVRDLADDEHAITEITKEAQRLLLMAERKMTARD